MKFLKVHVECKIKLLGAAAPTTGLTRIVSVKITPYKKCH